MAASTLNIGITGLNAAQANLQTTGQNITNASTPGYTRQQVVQKANQPMFTGSGFLGQGVNVETVKRVYSQYLTTQVLGAQAGAAEMDSYQSQVSQINNLVADTSAGLSPAMSGFFGSLSELAANPASTPSRQALLSSAQSLVSRFQSLDQRLSEIRAGSNTQIASEVTLINSYAQQIGDINQRITIAQSAGASQPANDLLDQRDQLISDLNKEVRVSTVPQSDGTLSIFIGSGQPLVTGTQASVLKTEPNSYDVFRTDVALTLPTGSSFTLPDSQLTGGTLGGLLAFRNQSLDSAQNALGRVAIALAQSFNDQHKLGQDLAGAPGGDFFNVPVPTVLADRANPAPEVTVSATISNMAALTTSDYRLSSNGGGNYTLLRLSDNKVLVSNGAIPASIDGLSISTSGNAVNGSSYLIQPTRAGARDIAMALNDTRNIAIAAPVRTAAPLTNTGAGSISVGVVTSVTATPPLAPITLRYLTSATAPTTSLDGFPVGSTVDPGDGQLYQITSPTMRVPYTVGNNLSFNGIGVTIPITSTPVNGDAFTIDPLTGPAPQTNDGLTPLFGVPPLPVATTQGAAIGSAAPAMPLTIQVGINDQFNITLEGAGPSAVIVAPGTYATATALATAVQAAIGAGATVSVDSGSNKLMVTSTTTGSGLPVVLGAGAGLGYNDLFGGGSTSGIRGVQSGSVTLPNPVDIKAGINDRFDISVDGTTSTILVPAGSYTPTSLASQLQTTINATAASPGVSVSLDGSSQLVVTSNKIGAGSSIALTNTPASLSVMNAIAANLITRTDSLPSVPITIAYDKKTNTLSGFPVGASVSVPGDSKSPYAISSTLDKVDYTPGATISFNGLSFAISGALADGDTFTIGPNSNGVSDNRNALLLGQLQSLKVLDGSATSGGTTSFQGAYAAMVNQIGNKTREVQSNGKALQSLTDQAQNARDSVSAVNLDEEAANLLRYQQAYQASAKLISIAGKLFDSLLAI